MLLRKKSLEGRPRLAVVLSHPIQYYSPWFRYIAEQGEVQIKVFYLWTAGVTETEDPDFKTTFRWDVPLLEGYDASFIENISKAPGTSHFKGLINPGLFEAVSRFDPGAVLIFGYKYQSILTFIARWSLLKKAPLLFRGDSHLLGRSLSLKSLVARQAIRAVYSRFAAFLYVGSANRAYFRHHSVPQSKLFFAPHTVDNTRFMESDPAAQGAGLQWRRELGIPENNQLVLFAGKLEQKKRPQDLLEAFLQISLPNASLLFVGSGALEGKLRERARGHSAVYFAPFQNQSQMPRTYASADIYVLPSAGHEETWGLAVNEAMCMSRPAIVSNEVGCADDLIFPEINGLVFPAGDVTALAEALRTALENPRRLKAWGAESRRIIGSYSYTQATAGLKNALSALGVLKG